MGSLSALSRVYIQALDAETLIIDPETCVPVEWKMCRNIISLVKSRLVGSEHNSSRLVGSEHNSMI